MSRTAAGDLAGAETIYRDLANQDPEQGLPALARFLSLTGNGERLDAFLSETVANQELSSMLRARVLLEAGHTEQATAFLRECRTRDDSPALSWFAAGVFARAGLPEEAGRLYLERLRQAVDATEAREALGGLLATPALITPAERPLLERWLLQVDLPAEERLAFLDEVAKPWPTPETTSSDFEALLLSIQAFAAGDMETALAVLPLPSTPDAAGRLFALQRLRTLSQLGRSGEAGRWAVWLLGDKPSNDPAAAPEDSADMVYQALESHEADAVERANQLIRMRPYDPEPMRRLMRYYHGTGLGRPEQVPDLIGLNATNPQLLGQCGYVLATEGFPAEGLRYYDRALSIDPEDPFVRLNRAACLTRLGRHSEAEMIYRDLLEHGHKGRAYHLHELILRLWVMAQDLAQEHACLAYLNSLAQRQDIPWREAIDRELIAVLSRFDLGEAQWSQQ